MKAGSLDNYLLTTHPRYLDSRFGLHLKRLIQAKIKQGDDFKMPFIPGTCTQNRTRRTKREEYARVPEVWAPAQIRARTDFSEFYEKPPQEMSRYELEELERIMKEADEGSDKLEELEEGDMGDEYDEDGNLIDKLEKYKATPEYKSHRDEFRKLHPMRMNVFRRYWARFRYNKRRRERLIEVFAGSDEQFEFFLGDEFVPW